MNNSNSETPNVTIVGAGLAGSLLASLLARQGMTVAVYEKRNDMRRETMSAGRSINLALAERGIHALRQAHLFESIEDELVPMRGRMLHAADGKKEMQRYGSREKEVIYSVSRGELNKVLINAAESRSQVTFHFNAACREVNLEEKTILVGDANEAHPVPYQHLIGADGAGSPVRKSIVKAAECEYSSDFLDHGYKELCIPAGKGGTYQIDRNALHIWPRGGYMLIALPNSDGSFTLTLFLANEGSPSFAELKTQEDVQCFFEQHFADAMAMIPNLTDDFFANPTGPLGTVRCEQWHYEDSALILGDAAHAIVPFHGQGMNCAFEDCAILDEMLRVSNDWGGIFAEFCRQRRPAADAIADMAIENYLVMRDSVRDPKFHLKKQLEFELERRHSDRFVPRYSMVMFHRIPYDEVIERGKIQSALLNDAMSGADELSEIDFDNAAKLVKSRLDSMV